MEDRVTPGSPLPWKVGERSGCVVDERGYGVVEAWVGIGRNPDTNARFIVTACNAYPSLLAQRDALKEALTAFFAKWPDVERVVNGYIAFQHIRMGTQYNGPNIAAELEAMRSALALCDQGSERQREG